MFVFKRDGSPPSLWCYLSACSCLSTSFNPFTSSRPGAPYANARAKGMFRQHSMSLSLKIHVAAGMLQTRVVGGERERGAERFEFTVGDVPGDTNGPFKQLEEMGDEDNSGHVALNEACMTKIKHMFEAERTAQGFFRLLQIRRFPRGTLHNAAEAKIALASLSRGVDGETLRRMACFLPTAVQTQWSPTMRCTMVGLLLRTARVHNYAARPTRRTV